MKVDLLVTTYKRATDLQILLKNLEEQVYTNFQLQIFDGTPDASVEEVVQSYLSQKRKLEYRIIFHKTISGMTRQRNIAVDNTRGDVSIFLDDDVELEAEYLIHVIKVFQEDEMIAGLNGFDTKAIVHSKGKKLGKRKSFYKFIGLLPDIGPARYLPWGHGTPHFLETDLTGTREVDLLIGHNMAFRTYILKKFRFSNFFEDYPTYVLYDDQDICLRIRKDYKLVLSYMARLKHNISPSGRPPQTHYGFQAFFNAYRNWRLYGRFDIVSIIRFWLWELLDTMFQFPNKKTRNISIGRLRGMWWVVIGRKRYISEN